MKVIPTKIPEVLIFEPDVYEDKRGSFFESFNQKKFDEAVGKEVQFVQDNQSYSKKGVLRGLHYQREPMAQGKLVRIISGEVFDVAVDIRRNSPTFGQYVSFKLSGEHKHMLWIPEGFAHGFLVLSDAAEFFYKITNYWAPKLEGSICWNDPTLNIKWPVIDNIYLSVKDQQAQSLEAIKHDI